MKYLVLVLFVSLAISAKADFRSIPSEIPIPADSIKEKDQQKTLGEYLIVVGTYKNEMQAIYYFNNLCNKDIPAYFFHDKERGNYYVHLGRYYFEEDAKQVLKQRLYPQLRKSLKKVKSYPQE